MIINNAPTDTLDPASPLVNLGSKLGIDATQKTNFLKAMNEKFKNRSKLIKKQKI